MRAQRATAPACPHGCTQSPNQSCSTHRGRFFQLPSAAAAARWRELRRQTCLKWARFAAPAQQHAPRASESAQTPTCTGRKVTGVPHELAGPLRPARAHPAPRGGAQRLTPLLGHLRAPGVPISPRAARRPPEQGRCAKGQVQPAGAHRPATCAAARTGAPPVRARAANAPPSTLGTILRPPPTAGTRAASTKRGHAYLKPGARCPGAAASLRTADWPVPGAP